MSEILNMYGDEIGYVKLLDSMGDDYTPAEDARTSTDKGRLGHEKDTALQERLMVDNHTSPFEGVVVKFEVCAPLFVIREADRHRTLDKNSEEDPFEMVGPEEGMRKFFSRNEMSGRYIQMPDLYYFPPSVRGQSTTNKQGGGQDTASISPEVAQRFQDECRRISKEARANYTWAVEQGIEKGLARICNTQNQYTKIRYTGSLKNFFDALYLRLPSVVLWECRVVFEGIRDLLKQKFPQAMSSWENLVYNGVRLTGPEAKFLRDLLEEDEALNREHPDVAKIFKKLGVK